MKIYLLAYLLIVTYLDLGCCEDSFLNSDYIESESPPESARTLLKFSDIQNSFKLTKEEVSAFSKSFDTASIGLLWPSTWEECAKANLFLAVVKPKDKSKPEMIVKFQKKSTVKSWYNEKDKTTECAEKIGKTIIPMEYAVSKEMSGKPRISQFFADNSNVKGTKTIYLASHYFKNSITLNDWFKNQTSSKTKKNEIEKLLKEYFKQMHEALMNLKRKNYIYTDFRPQNVLINLNNNKGSAFLMNLNNVVTLSSDSKLNSICATSKEFFPLADDKADMEVKTLTKNYLSLNNNSPENLLIWTYCASLMSLVCPEFEKNREAYFVNRKIYVKMSSLKKGISMIKAIGCKESSTNFSAKLMSFLETCLIKDSKLKKFEEIVKQDWFKD